MGFISLRQAGTSVGQRPISATTLNSAFEGGDETCQTNTMCAAGAGKCFSSGLIAAHAVAVARLSPARYTLRDQAAHPPHHTTPQAGDGGAGAGHQHGNGGAGQLWTFYGTGQSCRCSEHCLELSCDHGRMRFIKCYVCGSDWLIPAVKQNPMKDIKIKPIPTKVVRW